MWPLATLGTAQLISGTFPRWSAACPMSAPTISPTKMSVSDTQCRLATKMSPTPRQKCRPEQYKNNNTRENNTRAGARARETAVDILREAFPGDERLTAALLSFAESRAAGKHPLTANAAKLACSKLSKLADEANIQDRSGYMVAVLEQSILRGWEGLFKVNDWVPEQPALVHRGSGEDRPRMIGEDINPEDLF